MTIEPQVLLTTSALLTAATIWLGVHCIIGRRRRRRRIRKLIRLQLAGPNATLRALLVRFEGAIDALDHQVHRIAAILAVGDAEMLPINQSQFTQR